MDPGSKVDAAQLAVEKAARVMAKWAAWPNDPSCNCFHCALPNALAALDAARAQYARSIDTDHAASVTADSMWEQREQLHALAKAHGARVAVLDVEPDHAASVGAPCPTCSQPAEGES